MPRPRTIAACDCETDPFSHGAVIEPFIWGYFDNRIYEEFDTTKEFVKFVAPKRIVLYAHNGGKFDFMFLLPFTGETKAQIINGRIVAMKIGNCELRDSYAIIPEKLEKFGGKKDIEHWKLARNVRADHMKEIREYLYYDCKTLYDGVAAYRNIAGRRTTIASNALSFSRKLGIDAGKSNFRFDSKYRKFYFGGRTECFQPGTHHNIKLLDIHSAYPFAMLHEHASGTEFSRQSSLAGLSDEDLKRSFIVLSCHSKGAFPIRTPDGLSFPHTHDTYHVSGWEYLVARDHGLISAVQIESVRTAPQTINFRSYVEHWYDYKNRHSDKLPNGKKKFPIEYMIGKIMMNSLYGKLAQNPARYYDYKIVEAGTPLDSERKWELHTEFQGHEIHRRESLWKYKYELGVQWEAKAIFNNVATGASITGFTRAHLLKAMISIGWDNVIYCDTDGIVCKDDADLSKLSFSDAIGDWELEDSAPLGHFARKKVYGIKLSNGESKIASKGSKLTFQQIEKLMQGEVVKWKNPAPTFSIDGSYDYIVRSIKADPRLILATQ